ncbi:hypothetical protein [Pseudomonas sp. IT-P4]|uniref:hypothetical protein n=1 Tax=Pseudomonas sp. IT-P4 TaxID=3026446 RepID=UPI0039E0B95E
MSRSVGLREDQRWSEELATRILQWLPDEPRWYFREQARSHMGPQSKVGASLLAKGATQSAKI